MSKVKKILAMVLSLAMVMGMSMTTFAATGRKPVATDKKAVTVSNVEAGATVTAYQIVKANYNENGFVNYTAVNGVTIANPLKPSPEEVTTIAKNIETLELEFKPMTATGDQTTYTAELEPGYWMVLVNGTVKVYNPMLVGVYYSVSGSDSEMEAGDVDAASDWTLEGTDGYAKSSEVTITKTADVDTQNLGGLVNYTVTTTVPDYSDQYETVKFDVKDTLNGVELNDGAITVTAEGLTEEDYNITGNIAGSKEFTVSFVSNWVKNHPEAEITITYVAKMVGEAVNEDPHANHVELFYTNNPGEDDGYADDFQNVYTFDIGGETTGNIIQKVRPGEGSESGNQPLENAEFTLYTDSACKTPYTNSTHGTTPTAKTDSNGKLHITGLAAGTYYLKETKAPDGYTLNNTIYEIKITATVEEEILTAWNIKVTDMTSDTSVDNSFTVSQGTAVAGEKNQLTQILNTKIANLPGTGGIGTTIFTIGGCAIMIAAAGLFFASRRKSSK